MLTADLAMSWQRGDRITPRYIDTGDEEYVRVAEDFVEVFREHEGQTRAALEQYLAEYVGTGTDYKVLRGLIKLLTDRCEFETEAPADPPEIRRALFLKARVSHPVVTEETRAAVIEETAKELLSEPDALAGALYADLPE